MTKKSKLKETEKIRKLIKEILIEETKLIQPNKQTNLNNLHDNYTKFQSHCSFICDALSCLILASDDFDEHTSMGVSYCCHEIKQKMQTLEQDLNQLRKKAPE